MLTATPALAAALYVDPGEEVAHATFPTEGDLLELGQVTALARQRGVAFDPNDEETWEEVPEGIRLWGFFIEEVPNLDLRQTR